MQRKGFGTRLCIRFPDRIPDITLLEPCIHNANNVIIFLQVPPQHGKKIRLWARMCTKLVSCCKLAVLLVVAKVAVVAQLLPLHLVLVWFYDPRFRDLGINLQRCHFLKCAYSQTRLLRVDLPAHAGSAGIGAATAAAAGNFPAHSQYWHQTLPKFCTRILWSAYRCRIVVFCDSCHNLRSSSTIWLFQRDRKA